MALTPSTMLPLGTSAPDFALVDAVSGRRTRLDDLAGGEALVVLFVCNHCPFVIHVRDTITRLARDYASSDVRFVAINSNDVEKHPDDAPGRMRELALALGWEFPFLFDSDQSVAKAYRAACTPDPFVFDAGRRLVYRGQLDGSRPGNGIESTGADIRAALEAVLARRPVAAGQVPSVGCNIKWKPGNAPDYFG